jgi:hypothetical protein
MTKTEVCGVQYVYIRVYRATSAQLTGSSVAAGCYGNGSSTGQTCVVDGQSQNYNPYAASQFRYSEVGC